MNWNGICRVIGSYLFMLAALILVGLSVSLYYEHYVSFQEHPQPHPTNGFLWTFLLTMAAGIALRLLCKKRGELDLSFREAIFSVVAIWIVTIAFTALPFTLSGTLNSTLDAWFETVSGLTTTGSTILQAKEYNFAGEEVAIQRTFIGFQKIHYHFYGNVTPVIDPVTHATLFTGVEAVPKALLFWRSLLHWYGGIGIVLLFVALLPALGMRGKVLFRYETTGPSFQPLFPKIRTTAIVLFEIYAVLTLLCIIALLVTNKEMPVFDSINIAFSTLSTGGFSVKNASLAAYNNVSTEMVVMFFMIAGGTSFALYYELLRGRFYKLFEPETLLYIGILFFCGCLASWNIYNNSIVPLTESPMAFSSYDVVQSLRFGFFQIVSAMTNTGFATVDYDQWPFFAQSVMLMSMFFGGMAGSTSGGLKIIRVAILWQCLKSATSSLFRPSEVKIIRVGSREITPETVRGVLSFFLVTVLSSMIGVHLLILSGVDLETSFGLNGCCINNVGAAFRMAGPKESCCFLPPLGKIVCIAWMLLGRLEYYAWFALLLPSFWRQR